MLRWNKTGQGIILEEEINGTWSPVLLFNTDMVVAVKLSSYFEPTEIPFKLMEKLDGQIMEKK